MMIKEVFMNDTYLMHHGILGQKWGVRRFRNEDGTLTNAGKKRYSEDREILNSTKRKSVKQMSNKELKEATNRLNLENNYKNAKAQNFSKGKTIVGGILTAALIGAASEVSKNTISKGLNTAGKYATSKVKDVFSLSDLKNLKINNLG